MTRIYMRSYMDPFRNPDYLEALLNDFQGTNLGNLVFTHSIARALMLDDVEFEYDRCFKFTKKKIKHINDTCDYFIIPLANALRASFTGGLKKLTAAIRQIDIPCIVVGIGYQAGISGEYSFEHEWNPIVTEFIDAVLEKSEIIGLRGETTARYLEHLGYERERDFTVIGCPSMYMYGAELPCPKPLDLARPLRINMNGKSELGADIYHILERAMQDAGEFYYIPQNNYELTMMYTGIPMGELKPKLNFKDPWPKTLDHPIYKDDHGRGFVTVEAWREFLSKGDLNFGTRIHGNIMGVLSGVPTFIVAPDARVLELASYHNIAHATPNDIDMSGGLTGLLGGVDFNHILDGHEKRFEHYLDFLHANGLETIFDEPRGNAPFDERIAAVDFKGPFKALNCDMSPVHHVQAARMRKKMSEQGKI